jgi:exosome complex RNA-binding protein Rrp42 (RNase PH superfamily)
MSKENPLTIAERDFILEALQQNIRLDGRGVDDLRPLAISFGEEYGHVKVQLGDTRYVKGFCARGLRVLITCIPQSYRTYFSRSDETSR